MRRLLALGTAVAGGVTAGRLLVRGALTLDVGIGRSLRPLGPASFEIAAPPDGVFDVIAEPYLGRTPKALKEKLEVWERGSDMALAAHHTTARHRRTTTLETVRFERPTRIEFRLVRGPVPHVKESFELQPSAGGTRLTWQGELGADFWAVGRWWGEKVGSAWEQAVRESVASITAEAERRAR